MLSQVEQVMTEQKKLSDEDMQRVAEYLSSPVNRVERAPFKPLLLLSVLTVVVTVVTVVSLWYAWSKGVLTLSGF